MDVPKIRGSLHEIKLQSAAQKNLVTLASLPIFVLARRAKYGFVGLIRYCQHLLVQVGTCSKPYNSKRGDHRPILPALAPDSKLQIHD